MSLVIAYFPFGDTIMFIGRLPISWLMPAFPVTSRD